MKVNCATILCLTVLLACGSSAASAAVAQLSCAATTGAMLTANVSYYDVGLTQPVGIGSGSSGAGAGKVTFNPLHIHTSLANFVAFFEAAATGAAFSACTLTSRVGVNGTIEYDFKLVAVSSVDAIGQDTHADQDGPAAYTDVKLVFGALQVHTPGNARP